MAVALAQLAQSQPTGETAVYTSTGTKTMVLDIVIAAAADDIVSVSIVASGGTAGAANRIINALPVGPDAAVGQVVRIGMKQLMASGSFISVYAKGSATVTISGATGVA